MGEPVGEDAWVSLVDEGSRSAADLEQRVEVVELYKRAVSAEPYSLRLWVQYCEWIWSLHTDCQSSDAGWSEEEQRLGQELFSLDTAIDLWQQGAHAIRYRLDDSHSLWNRYMSIELWLLAKTPSPAAVERVRALYLDRLQVPHATWEETSQAFSTFVTRYDEPHWEETMVRSTQLAKNAKEIYGQREEQELSLVRSVQSGDKDKQKAVLTEYLEWETIQSRKKNGIPALCFALYERALLILPTDVTLWEDYAGAVNGYIGVSHGRPQDCPDLLQLLQRSVKHCPWSGMLWSRYMLRAEIEHLDFRDVEQIKHAATSSDQLDRNGMTDVYMVYGAWCNYLRRRAVDRDATDEDGDLADVGMPSALDGVEHWGEPADRKNAKGDPTFQIQRCWIQYLTQKGLITEAREQWHDLVKPHGDSYEFWLRYYQWEMDMPHTDNTRPFAAALLKQAIQRRTLDWPEKIMEMYLSHCSTYEFPVDVANAIDFVHRNAKGVAKRRQREAAEAAAAYAEQQRLVQPAEAITTDESPSGSKRKRDAASEADGSAAKKVKAAGEDLDAQSVKRDRENTSILVSNLPLEATQTKVRQYFKEYGHINNLTLKPESDKQSSTALIEFRSVEDVQSALLRDGKYFADKQISVVPGTGLTLYLTNYPPTADEDYLRNLFKDCGEIFSFRWPSLKYNTHRRFCYVSFRTAAAAAAATALDGELLEGKYKLEAKYSDPGRKKPREGAMIEGREVHIAGLDRGASEDDLQAVFSKYGAVESVRILRNIAGKSKGSAFVVFAKAEDATKALELDKTKFWSQILTVELATPTNFKATATTGSLGTSAAGSPVPSNDLDSRMSGAGSPAAANNHTHASGQSRAEITARTITLLNVPDTVNDARLSAICAPYGRVVKLVLRPDHQGAIVEFEDVAAAGKASLGLEGYEIVGGRRLRTGGLKDLFESRDEQRTDRIVIGGGAKKADAQPEQRMAFMQAGPTVRRPGAGGRGGLGVKRGLGFKGPGKAAVDGVNGNSTDAREKKALKSNADFKAMFLRSGEDGGGGPNKQG
ncbi:hypothetical protein VE03_08647 [Pseudogymnoascus sp. 23342-1-I1]|nr:hypothetical protein VE03_08647 [Pseudogymnoascus sp. 23342-1-I1]